MRSSIGGWLEKSAIHPGAPLMPDAAIDCGSEPGCMPPRRMSAPIIGRGVPSSRAEPASARNSRRRENHMTIIEARMLNTIWHTITACRAPCNLTTGISYPLADGSAGFDSGQLGFGPRGFTAAANRKQWNTPARLARGTYTYFCRVHPFMRGAFRVQ